MNITPINNVPFGIKIKTNQNKPTDRLIKAFNYVGRLIDTKLKCYDAEGKVCLHFTTKN